MRASALICIAAWASCAAAQPTPPTLTAKSAIVVDAATGHALFGKDADTPRYPASTTKILTALLVLETIEPDTRVVAPADTETVEGASLHLRPGESLTAQNLVWAILLRSANDASHAAAVHVAGSDVAFAKLMNARALELGCRRTHFENPHGLPNRRHTTTARDLARIACAALQHSTFARMVDTRKVQIERSLNQEDRWLISRNDFLAHDPTYDGVKTGYTRDAGQCFVGSATRNGVRYVTVILGSSDWRADQKALMEWAFAHGRAVDLSSRIEALEPVLLPKAGHAVPVLCGEAPVLRSVKHPDRFAIRLDLEAGREAPFQKGDRIGSWVVSDADGEVMRVPAVSGAVAPRQAESSATSPVTFAVLGTLVAGSLLVRRKSRKLGEGR